MVDNSDSDSTQQDSHTDEQDGITEPHSHSEDTHGENDAEKCCRYETAAWNKLQFTYQRVVSWLRARDSGFWTAWATIVMAATTVVYTHYARKQWQEMHISVGDTHALALQALAQAKLQQEQLIGTNTAAIPINKPWPHVITDDLDYLSYSGIGMSFPNEGKVQATNFSADVTLSRKILPSYKALGHVEHKQISQGRIRAPEQNGPQIVNDSPIVRFDAQILSESDIKLLNDLGEELEMSGHITYDNGFGSAVNETFCFLYTTIPQHTFIVSGANVGGGGSWYTCDDGRYMIAEALRWKQKPKQDHADKSPPSGY